MTTVSEFKPDTYDIGDSAAEVGSVGWAKFMRLHLQSMVKRVDREPKHVAQMIDLLKQHRAWTVLNKPDGGFFSSFEEFCGHKQPWGLGKPYEELRPFLEAAVGKRALDLVVVAPDARPAREHAEDGTFKGKGQTRNDCGNGDSHRKEENLRAILRAPEVVQTAYRAGLIGQVDAAKLGPKSPSPTQAAKIAQAALDIAPIVAAAKSKPEREKKKIQREVNATARAALGVEKPAPETPYQQLIGLIAKLGADDLRPAIRLIQNRLASVGVVVRVDFQE